MKFSKILIAAVFSLAGLHGVAQRKEVAAASMELRAIQKKYALDPDSPLLSRVATTPDDIIQRFREAGMSPTEHRLTKEELQVVSKAFAALPPMHRQVLKQHLKSISFLDNMPNTAFTAPVTKDEGVNLYHIAFRSGILHQTISEWVTEKERNCFAGGDSTISVCIEAGLLNALTYVMLHESTHVVDGSLHLIAVDTVAGKPQPNNFTAGFSKGIWKNINTYDWPFTDSIVVKSRFRPGGRPFLTTEGTKVYQALSQTPFASLYSTASWHEDLAEIVTIYHLTYKLKQPFRFLITQHGKQLFSYEPMKSALVQKRIGLLRYFYTTV